MADYDIAQAFAEIENELIDSMMRNFSRHRAEETEQGYNWTQWQAEQLKALEDYKKNNRNKFGKEFDSLNQKIRETVQGYRRKGNADQEYEILQAIKRGYKLPHGSNKPAFTGTKATAEFFKLNDRKLEALIKSTTNDLKKAETAVLRMSEDKYRKAIFNAQVYANTGAATYEKAVDMACRDMLRAGLNCVEYKNGARHTLSNYAEMAIRTANKRAYLRGEGERRQARGISTVVVNRRRGGCSHCAKYVGKVYIDDVYSGGKASDGDYPLLSEAIEDGLFHPNCKDSTSTYYEGITTLKPVSDDELKELDRRRKLEEHKNYYDNQAEKNQRIADYSLDDDNKRIYQQRAKASRKKAAEIENKLNVSVAKSENGDIIKVGSGNVALENQRYGRNKDTIVNKTYIDSGEYKRKYDNATDNQDVNKTLYVSAKEALKHRSGTVLEDMYWIDGVTGKVLCSVTDSTVERTIKYSDRIRKAVKVNNNIVTIHTHPSSMPPSIDDFNSCFNNGYKMCFVACHNGTVYQYSANEIVSSRLYSLYIQSYMNEGMSEFEAQLKAIDKLSQSYDIKLWEVSCND